jgi:hypothetical protein
MKANLQALQRIAAAAERTPQADSGDKAPAAQDAGIDIAARMALLAQQLAALDGRLQDIQATLATLVEQHTVKDWYGTEEVAKILGRAEFTVREWCRNGRVNAVKRGSGRGAHAAWVISHAELQRYRREGLLPATRPGQGHQSSSGRPEKGQR